MSETSVLDDGTVSAVDISHATGNLSYRIVDYWTRVGYLIPCEGQEAPGSGKSRRYPKSELDVAVTMRALIDAGIRAETAAPIARIVVGEPRPVTHWLTPRIAVVLK